MKYEIDRVSSMMYTTILFLIEVRRRPDNLQVVAGDSKVVGAYIEHLLTTTQDYAPLKFDM